MSKIQKFLAGVGTLCLGLAVTGFNYAMAAEDALFASFRASTTTWIDDNKFAIGGTILGVIFVWFSLAFGKRIVLWGFGKIMSVIPTKRRGGRR